MKYLPIGRRHKRMVNDIDKMRKDLPRGEKIVYTEPGVVLTLRPRGVELEHHDVRMRREKFDSLFEVFETLSSYASRPAWIAFDADSPDDIEDPYEELIDEDSDAWDVVQELKKLLPRIKDVVESWEPEYRAASLEGQLIKLGSNCPDLRDHIRPILAELDKVSDVQVKQVMYDVTMACRNEMGVRKIRSKLARHSRVPDLEFFEVGQTPSDGGFRGNEGCVYAVSHDFEFEGSARSSNIKRQLEHLWEALTQERVKIRIEDVLPA